MHKHGLLEQRGAWNSYQDNCTFPAVRYQHGYEFSDPEYPARRSLIDGVTDRPESAEFYRVKSAVANNRVG